MYALLITDAKGNTIMEHVAVNSDDDCVFEYKGDHSEFRKSYKLLNYVRRTYPEFIIYEREFDISEVISRLTTP